MIDSSDLSGAVRALYPDHAVTFVGLEAKDDVIVHRDGTGQEVYGRNSGHVTVTITLELSPTPAP